MLTAVRTFMENHIQMLSTKDKEPHESIGQTAGLIMTQMIGMAKSQKKEYQPDIIREVGMDLIHELYMVAGESGAIENLPEDDSDGYQAIIEQSALEAVKMYGENLLQTGQVNVESHKKELQHQMQREADSGELDNRGMEDFDEEARFAMAQRLKGVTNGQS